MSSIVTLIFASGLCEACKLGLLVRSTRVTFGFASVPAVESSTHCRGKLETMHYSQNWQGSVLKYVDSIHRMSNMARKASRNVLELPLSVDMMKAEVGILFDGMHAELKSLALAIYPDIALAVSKSVTTAGAEMKATLKQARSRSLCVEEIANIVAEAFRAFIAACVVSFNEMHSSLVSDASAIVADANQLATSLLGLHSLLLGDLQKSDSVCVQLDLQFHKAITDRVRSPGFSSRFIFTKYRRRETAWYVFYAEMRRIALFTDLTNSIYSTAVATPGRYIRCHPDYIACASLHAKALLIGEASIEEQQENYSNLMKRVSAIRWAAKSPQQNMLGKFMAESAKYFSARPHCFKNKLVESYRFQDLIILVARILRA